jgi:hypothetical protein
MGGHVVVRAMSPWRGPLVSSSCCPTVDLVVVHNLSSLVHPSTGQRGRKLTRKL